MAYWDVSTASVTGYATTTEVTTGTGIAFKSDGASMFVLNVDNDTVFQYTLSTPWLVSTATYASKSYYVNAADSQPYGLDFSSDGSKMYTGGRVNHRINQWTLSTPWDVSTASSASKTLSVSGETTEMRDFCVTNSGTKVYVADNSGDVIYQYTLGTAWDMSTGSYDSKSIDITSQESTLYTVYMKPDGTAMYAAGTAADQVFQYTLGTAWDISTASYTSKSFDVNPTFSGTGPHCLVFRPDGSAFYIHGSNSSNDRAYQYDLTAGLGLSFIGVAFANIGTAVGVAAANIAKIDGTAGS